KSASPVKLYQDTQAHFAAANLPDRRPFRMEFQGSAASAIISSANCHSAKEVKAVPYETIEKPDVAEMKVRPNLADYQAQRAAFKWDDIDKELDGLPGGGLNIAYEALDRHVAKGQGGKTAILWEGKGGEQESLTYAEVARLANRWANVLRGLGVQKGDRV